MLNYQNFYLNKEVRNRRALMSVVVVAGDHRSYARTSTCTGTTQICRGHLLDASNQAWETLIMKQMWGTHKIKQRELQN